MLTCFIRNRYDPDDWLKIISLWALLLLPAVCFGYSIYAFIMIFKKRKIQENKDFRLVMIKFLIYSALFIVFYLPTPILYAVTVNRDIQPSSVSAWFSFVNPLFKYNINTTNNII